MFGKDAEIGCEYVVPVAVCYYFSYDRLVNLYNSNRSTAVGVLVMNIIYIHLYYTEKAAITIGKEK